MGERLPRYVYHPGRREQAPRGCRTAVLDGIAVVVILGGVYLGITQWNRITTAAAVSAWTDEIRGKLTDPSRNLTPEEKFYPQVRVVAAGKTLEELWEMQKEGTRVNVRYSPATEVIATIAQGSKILNVVLTTADSSLPKPWGVFRCSDASGIEWAGGIKPGPEEICTVHADYLDAVK